jgi:hypothetical protein
MRLNPRRLTARHLSWRFYLRFCSIYPLALALPMPNVTPSSAPIMPSIYRKSLRRELEAL